jgi:hypothetical protein
MKFDISGHLISSQQDDIVFIINKMRATTTKFRLSSITKLLILIVSWLLLFSP